MSEDQKRTFESPLYNIGVVRRMTGVPIATLHAWERRYGFPKSARSAGGHRLYSERDIARLRWIKTQVDQGMSARQAVTALQEMEADGRLSLSAPAEVLARPAQPAQPPPLLQGQLMEALLKHELEAADQVMGEMLAFYPPEQLTLEIIGPVLNEIGEAWEQGRISVATEHLASNYLRHRLLMWMVTGPRSRPVSPTVLACAPGEWHEGSLLMLGVLLRRQGWPVAYLGQSVPFQDLAALTQDIHPSAVVLVAMCEETARGLKEWPDWIAQLGGKPVVAFGGRPFSRHPELAGIVPGIYLGSSLQAGLAKLIELLSSQAG